MTDEQINRAIAEACGWTQIHVKDFSEMGVPCFMTMGLPPKFIHIENAQALPNYCGDLNAMHEAEKTLEGYLQNGFVYELRWITESKFWGDFGHCHATARQRAEAFLRTLDKWDGSTDKDSLKVGESTAEDYSVVYHGGKA